ncbi:MAG: hypothetical protein DME50_01760 [Verrucomicrobia bacterium]|nr:MAG: hypothetical protein DME50_01760 [Verrucomicrobiota bacterium]
MRIKNAGRPFDNQAVQFTGPDGLAKSLSQPVQKIENKRFFNLNFLMRTFEPSNLSRLRPGSENPPSQRRKKQSEEKSRPHDAGPAYFEVVS